MNQLVIISTQFREKNISPSVICAATVDQGVTLELRRSRADVAAEACAKLASVFAILYQ
jgi:hypothetical protein